jgi:quercetin dioxygenase-like cupin family protein
LPAPERELSHYSELREIEPLQIWEGVVARAVAGDEATLAAIELDPGAVVPEHAHVNEQTGILIRGSLTFTIGGETKKLLPGAMWVIPGHTPHSVEVGPEGAGLVELFAPPRADWAGLQRLDPSTDAATLGLA